MAFGPLEFAVYLQRKDRRQREAAAVKAARAAAAPPLADENILSVITGPSGLVRVAEGEGTLETARVYEAVATPPPELSGVSSIRVQVRRGTRRLVLVLSSHHAVDWQIEREPDTSLEAVLLAGAGDCTVNGAGDVLVTSIGGFYAFRMGSLEFRHLEDEIMRCTGRRIESFQSNHSGSLFEVGAPDTSQL